MKKLNNKGVAHHFVLALLVVGIISAFTFQAVAGHANQLDPADRADLKTSAHSTGISNPNNCKQVPTPHVVYGQHNACVAYLQTKLGFSGSNVDGQFGKMTAASVKTIQVAAKLKDASGRDVGKCTWSAINHTAISKNCLRNPVAAQATAKPSPIGYCTYHSNTESGGIARNQKMTQKACSELHGTFITKLPTAPTTVTCTYMNSSHTTVTYTAKTAALCSAHISTLAYGTCSYTGVVSGNPYGGVKTAWTTKATCTNFYGGDRDLYTRVSWAKG